MSTTVSTRTPGTLNPTRQQLDELDALLKRMLELPVNRLDDTNDAEVEDVAEEPASPPPVSLIPAPKGRELRKPAMESKPATPPVSYMVVETASPRPLPAASGFETRPYAPLAERGENAVTPRLTTPTPMPEESLEEEPFAPAEPPVQTPVADSSSNEAEVWVPLRSTWQPSAQTWQPLAESWQQAKAATPTPAATPSRPAPLPDPPVPVSMPVPVSVPVAVPESKPQTGMGTGQLGAVEPRLSLSAEDAPVSAPLPLLPLVWFNQGFDACVAPLGDAGRWLSGSKGRQTLGVVGLLCLAAAMVIVVSAGMGWTW